MQINLDIPSDKPHVKDAWQDIRKRQDLDPFLKRGKHGHKIVHITLHWRHNDRDGVSNRQPHDCLLNCLFRRRSKKTSKLRVTDLCAGNSPVTGEFPAQKASNAENVFIWWRHHASHISCYLSLLWVWQVLSELRLCQAKCQTSSDSTHSVTSYPGIDIVAHDDVIKWKHSPR